MAMKATRTRGGFAGPVQLSPWIRDYLSDGHEAYAHEVYSAYRQELRECAKNGTCYRRGMSYDGFRVYLYAARQLGLIEYVMENGQVKEEEAETIDGSRAPYLAPRRYFHAVADELQNPAWRHLMASYQNS